MAMNARKKIEALKSSIFFWNFDHSVPLGGFVAHFKILIFRFSKFGPEFWIHRIHTFQVQNFGFEVLSQKR
jgi:hypothetical protein